jgi:hypothetical protein
MPEMLHGRSEELTKDLLQVRACLKNLIYEPNEETKLKPQLSPAVLICLYHFTKEAIGDDASGLCALRKTYMFYPEVSAAIDALLAFLASLVEQIAPKIENKTIGSCWDPDVEKLVEAFSQKLAPLNAQACSNIMPNIVPHYFLPGVNVPQASGIIKTKLMISQVVEPFSSAFCRWNPTLATVPLISCNKMESIVCFP